MPSGPGLLKLSQSHTACFTSSIENGLVKLPPSLKDNLWKGMLPTLGLSPPLDLKLLEKWLKTAIQMF